ncbi:MAG: 4-(cytidine 5'-diphospho)-2-C-methyl-D-erythritol kinase [Ruminococcaceae bacterium]|nr:4-(cytidine 5'-diphospho)-2-C-methyl-D-erythritol kinase [Oscillospiraceae bacterium]
MILHETAYAKLNLTLDVLEKRPDGYHDICTVMQSISLCDDIALELNTGREWSVRCNVSGIPLNERNLVWKAARVFFDAVDIDPNGIEITICKRIPSEAGLAGGSADAAAVLRMLNRHYDAPFDETQLAELGAKIGSDVPFCVVRSLCLAEGRGERLTKLGAVPEMHYVVCKPQISFSTPKLYAKLDEIHIRNRPDTKAMCDALRYGDVRKASSLLCNVFEEAADDVQIAQIKQELLANGALGALMTGSGSAVYGLFETQIAAQRAYEQLKLQPWQFFCAKSV